MNPPLAVLQEVQKMIAVDTNILVYAHREDSEWNSRAFSVIQNLVEGNKIWAIPYPCLHEFYAIVTHAKIYDPPTPLKPAIQQIEYWFESPSLTLIGETEGYWHHLKKMLVQGQISGTQIHDARIAAICARQGVDVLYTADRDFSRFPLLTTYNPLFI